MAVSGQAIEILYVMRRGPMIHQCDHGTGAGSREHPWMPSWGGKSGDSLGWAELCQVDCCAATFAAHGHVAGLDFPFFYL